MARTVTQIHNEILNNISNDTQLNTKLTSTSTTAIYRVFAYVVAVSINILESYLDIFKADVTVIRNDAIPATDRWYVWRSKRFQYDDITPQVLSLDEDTYTIDYDTIDETKRIITVASCYTSQDRDVVIKVAKGDIGALSPLSTTELDAFKSYLQQLRSAGQRLNIISDLPDLITINADVYYDAQFIQTDVLNSITNNINTYLQNLEFDGTVRYQKVVDKIQISNGVKDLKINEMTGRDSSKSFNDRIVFDRIYQPISGYLNIDPANGLSITINLIPS